MKIELLNADDKLTIHISDNGHGFDPEADYPGHFGLRTMRQRANEAKLLFTIQSSLQGTVVTLTSATRPRNEATGE